MAMFSDMLANDFDEEDAEDQKVDPEMQRFCENFTFEVSETFPYILHDATTSLFQIPSSFPSPVPHNRQNAHTCWVCNGYYGPSYEEPVCGACHSFLFASSCVEEGQGLTLPESSDEDSGNDEPPYNAAGVNASHSNANVPANMNVGRAGGGPEEDENMEEDEDDIPEDIIEANVMAQDVDEVQGAVDELPLVRPRPNPPRNVLQYLDLLSIPRQNDRIDDPRIEALATEGE